MFWVQKHHLMETLVYLKANNEDYHHIVILQNNADQYPADDIVQNLPQIDPQLLRLPQEAATAANRDSVIEDASML